MTDTSDRLKQLEEQIVPVRKDLEKEKEERKEQEYRTIGIFRLRLIGSAIRNNHYPNNYDNNPLEYLLFPFRNEGIVWDGNSIGSHDRLGIVLDSKGRAYCDNRGSNVVCYGKFIANVGIYLERFKHDSHRNCEDCVKDKLLKVCHERGADAYAEMGVMEGYNLYKNAGLFVVERKKLELADILSLK